MKASLTSSLRDSNTFQCIMGITSPTLCHKCTLHASQWHQQWPLSLPEEVHHGSRQARTVSVDTSESLKQSEAMSTAALTFTRRSSLRLRALKHQSDLRDIRTTALWLADDLVTSALVWRYVGCTLKCRLLFQKNKRKLIRHMWSSVTWEYFFLIFLLKLFWNFISHF